MWNIFGVRIRLACFLFQMSYIGIVMFWLFLLWFFFNRWVWSPLLTSFQPSPPSPFRGSCWEWPLSFVPLAVSSACQGLGAASSCEIPQEMLLWLKAEPPGFESRTTWVQTLAPPSNKLNAPGKAAFLWPVSCICKMREMVIVSTSPCCCEYSMGKWTNGP